MRRLLFRVTGVAALSTVAVLIVLTASLVGLDVALPGAFKEIAVAILGGVLIIAGSINWAAYILLVVAAAMRVESDGTAARAQESFMATLGGLCLIVVGIDYLTDLHLLPPLIPTILTVFGILLISTRDIPLLVRYRRHQ